MEPWMIERLRRRREEEAERQRVPLHIEPPPPPAPQDPEIRRDPGEAPRGYCIITD